MGGEGSGRWYRLTKKPVVEDALGLDVRKFAQWGALRSHWQGTIRWSYGDREPFASAGYTVMVTGGQGLVLTMRYCIDGKENIDQPIALQTTRPHYGGARWWFTCPSCQRRSGKLYLPASANVFACRRCYGLTYRSTQEHDKRLSYLLGHPGALGALAERVANNPVGASSSALILAMQAMEESSRRNRRTLEQIRAEARRNRSARPPLRRRAPNIIYHCPLVWLADRGTLAQCSASATHVGVYAALGQPHRRAQSAALHQPR